MKPNQKTQDNNIQTDLYFVINVYHPKWKSYFKKNFFFSSSAKSNKTFPQVILNWINFSFHKIYTENREILSFLLLFSYLVQRKKLLTLKSLVFNEFLRRTSLSFYFTFPLEKFTVLFAINFLARQKQSEMKIKTSHNLWPTNQRVGFLKESEGS